MVSGWFRRPNLSSSGFRGGWAWKFVLGALVVALSPLTASADFVFTVNGMSGGQTYSARATFTPGPSSLQIVLECPLAGRTWASQALSGISFHLSGSPTGAAFAGGSGSFVTVDPGGKFSPGRNAAGTSLNATSRWGLLGDST